MANPYAPPGADDASGDGGHPHEPGHPDRSGPLHDPGRPGPPDQPHQPGHPDRPGRPPPDPAAARRVARLVLRFGLLVLAALLVGRLRLPWSAAAPVVTLAALGYGVTAIVQGVRARVRASTHVLVGIGIGLTVVVLLQQVLVVALWPISMQLQECRDGALTIAAEDECRADYERRIRDLTRLPTPTG